MENDCPRLGLLVDIRRRTRLKYNNVIRKAKKNDKITVAKDFNNNNNNNSVFKVPTP